MNGERNILAELESRRKDLKMSRPALARRSGLSVPTVQGVLTGRKNANLSTVLAIAEALAIEIGIVRRVNASTSMRRQARAKARRLVAGAQGSAALEAQAVDEKVLRSAEQKIQNRLLSGPPLRLWA